MQLEVKKASEIEEQYLDQDFQDMNLDLKALNKSGNLDIWKVEFKRQVSYCLVAFSADEAGKTAWIYIPKLGAHKEEITHIKELLDYIESQYTDINEFKIEIDEENKHIFDVLGELNYKETDQVVTIYSKLQQYPENFMIAVELKDEDIKDITVKQDSYSFEEIALNNDKDIAAFNLVQGPIDLGYLKYKLIEEEKVTPKLVIVDFYFENPMVQNVSKVLNPLLNKYGEIPLIIAGIKKDNVLIEYLEHVGVEEEITKKVYSKKTNN